MSQYVDGKLLPVILLLWWWGAALGEYHKKRINKRKPYPAILLFWILKADILKATFRQTLSSAEDLVGKLSRRSNLEEKVWEPVPGKVQNNMLNTCLSKGIILCSPCWHIQHHVACASNTARNTDNISLFFSAFFPRPHREISVASISGHRTFLISLSASTRNFCRHTKWRMHIAWTPRHVN